jgi:hypothetical protein
VLTFALYDIQFLCSLKFGYKFGLMHLMKVLFYLTPFADFFFAIVSTNWNTMIRDPAEYHGS